MIQSIKTVSSSLAQPLDASPNEDRDRIPERGTSSNKRIRLAGTDNEYGLGQTWLLVPISGTPADPYAVTYLKTSNGVLDGEADMLSLHELRKHKSFRKVSSQFLEAFRESRKRLTEAGDPCREAPSTAEIQLHLQSRLDAISAAISQGESEVTAYSQVLTNSLESASAQFLSSKSPLHFEEPPLLRGSSDTSGSDTDFELHGM
jgi:hypothetical protein